MFHRLRIMPVAMLLLIAWTTILVIQQEQFRMMRTVTVTMITAMPAHGQTAAVTRNAVAQRLFALAGTAFNAQ